MATPFAELSGSSKDEMISSLVSIILNECGKDFSTGAPPLDPLERGPSLERQG